MENLDELAGDLELVIGVKLHPHHVDVAQFGGDEVLHSAYTCPLSSLATRHGPVQVLMSLRRLPCLDTRATRI